MDGHHKAEKRSLARAASIERGSDDGAGTVREKSRLGRKKKKKGKKTSQHVP